MQPVFEGRRRTHELGRGVRKPLRGMGGRYDGRCPLRRELARKAGGPLVELAIGNGRVAIPVVQVTSQRAIGIDASPAMLAESDACAVEAGVELDLREGRHARFRPRRAGSAHLLPLSRTPAPANLGGPPQYLRACHRLAPARRAVCLECLCLRPSNRCATRWHVPGRAGSPFAPLRSGRQPDRYCTRKRRVELLWWNSRTNGSGSSMSPVWNWRRYTAASPANRLATIAGNTSLLPAVE